MKLPKLFRKLLPISAVVVAIAMAARVIFDSAQLSLLSKVSEILFGLSLLVLLISFIGVLVVREIENALLRQFGEAATATVLAVIGVNERVNRVQVYRVKLEVHPSGGEPFIAVAEDVIRFINMVDTGDTVSVKYDPRTKEVALVWPKSMKTKKLDF
jgi:hypothetical protein